MKPVHDVRDRRANNMERACEALDGCRVDLLTYTSNPKVAAGVAYDVARRLGQLIDELEHFRARDLINMRKVES